MPESATVQRIRNKDPRPRRRPSTVMIIMVVIIVMFLGLLGRAIYLTATRDPTCRSDGDCLVGEICTLCEHSRCIAEDI